MNQKGGFFLLQFMIAFAALTIIMVMAVQSFTFLHRLVVRAHVERFFSSCITTRQRALITGQNQKIVCEQQKNSFFATDKSIPLANGIVFGVTNQSFGPPSAPTTLLTKPITFNNNEIICYPNGVVSSGSVYFTDTKKTCLYAITSDVSRSSRFRVYRFYAGRWIKMP